MTAPLSTADARQRAGSRYGAFAFASVILTCFSGYFFDRRYYHGEAMVLVTFGLGAVYAFMGTLGSRLLEEKSPRAFHLYFIFQCALLTALVFLSPVRGFFGIIVLPVVSQAIFDLGKRGAVLVGLYLFFISVAVWGFDFGWGAVLESGLNYVAAFAFTIVFTIISKQALIARDQAERLTGELEAANQQLREHARQAEDLATTRERNRLAREIHDGVGHYLTVVKTQLDAAAALIPIQPDKARDAVNKAALLTAEALADVRRSVGTLRTDTARPPLADLLRTLAAQAEPLPELHIAGTPRELSAAAEHTLFRAAQEALTNIRKHARATAASVALDFREPGRVRLTVTDNGRGPQEKTGCDTRGYGLRGVRERVEIIGGRLTAGPGSSGGFTLSIEVPA